MKKNKCAPVFIVKLPEGYPIRARCKHCKHLSSRQDNDSPFFGFCNRIRDKDGAALPVSVNRNAFCCEHYCPRTYVKLFDTHQLNLF